MILLDPKTERLVRRYVPPHQTIQALADYFAALADSTRVKIISALSISPMCVTDLSQILGLNQTTLSHQLQTLRRMGTLNVRRQGKICFYELADRAMLQLLLTASQALTQSVTSAEERATK